MRSNSTKQIGRSRGGKWDGGKILLERDWSNETITWDTIFDDPRFPVEIEVGIGKGTFLLERARRRREINLLGIEYAGSYAAYSADRARRAGLNNIRVIGHDAGDIFRRIPADTVHRVHIYFPDPWPKRKHHRRRLIQPPFVHHVQRSLTSGGQLLLVTDHRNYFEHMRRVLTDYPGFARTDFPYREESAEEVVGTNFERKYIEQGRTIYRMALLKYKNP